MINVLKAFLKRFYILVRIKRFYCGQKDEIDDFLHEYFKSNLTKTIVQIGANDGEMCDLLRPFFKKNSGSYKAILVEPMPFYANKLKSLYKDRPDIKIINAAMGEVERTETLYFIPPNVADLMNGDGPPNNWAHGQGSFDKNNVIHWIQQNSFRGDDYRKNIPYFLSCIESIEVPTLRTANIMPNCGNLLIVIDVQGFELQVLSGLDWSVSPAYIMLEDDLGKTDSVFAYLEAKGYRYLCGKLDKVFVHGSTLKS